MTPNLPACLCVSLSYILELSRLLDDASIPHLPLKGSLEAAKELREALSSPRGAVSIDDGTEAGVSRIPWGPDEVLWLTSLSESFYASHQAAEQHLQQAMGDWRPRRSTFDWADACIGYQDKLQRVRQSCMPLGPVGRPVGCMQEAGTAVCYEPWPVS